MAAFKDALDLTTRTIDRRARGYRNLVVLVAVVGIVTVVWAGIAWSGAPLLGLLLLFPLCGGFLVCDSFRVDRWRERILRLWIEEELDLGAFAAAVAGIRILPPHTLRAMLRSLPTGSHPLADFDRSREGKVAAAMTLAVHHRIASDRTLIAALAYSAIVASVTGAIVLGDWQILWGCLAALGVFAAGWFVRLIRLRIWRRSIRLPQAQMREMATVLWGETKFSGGLPP